VGKLRQWIAITVVVVIAIAAGGWFLLISPKNQEAADLRDQTTTQVSANSQLKTQLQVLKAQAKALPQQQAKLAAVAAKIPDNPALPALIRALTVAADDANVELLTLSPTKPAAVAAPAPGAVTGVGAAAPVDTSSAGTLQQIGVSLSVVGGYFQVEQFLDRLESLSRAMKVTQVAMSPGTNPVKVVKAAATPAPGSTGTSTSSSSGTPSTLMASITGTVFMATGRVTTAVAPTATTGK
jgi:Tfp pilus assembly protein PilO